MANIVTWGLIVGLSLATIPSRAEVILQYFETRWDEMYLRLPEMAEIGIDAIWHPSPTKAPIAGVFPNGGGGNVGYNLFDRFDLGDVPQRGARETRYGSKGSLQGMVENAHQTGIKIYPDIVFNHTGNGPHIETYPGMVKNDFHGWFDSNYPLNFKRAPRMSGYDDIGGGFGLTFQEELVSLFDINLEFDNRFSTGAPFYMAPGEFVRQPGQYDLYPFHNPGDALPEEHPVAFMERWINWLGYEMDYDGVRLDAPKHVIREFFGKANVGSGFNHQIQWNFDQRRGLSDGDQIDQMYANDVVRDDALIFAEMFIGSVGDVSYWRDWDFGDGVKMRYLDFPRLKSMMYDAFNNGNMATLNSFAGFDPAEGVMFAHSHDEDNLGKKELGYAYILTRIGIPVVYFTGNNYDPADRGIRNWLFMGYEAALGDYNNPTIPNLIYIHNQFARGREWTRSGAGDQDVFAYERYDDGNGNETPDSGESLLLVALNDSGFDQTRTFSTAFADGTVLKDYTGRQPNDVTVANGQVTITIPGWSGQGFVCYAPYNATADGDPIRFSDNGQASVTMPWVVPGGARAADKPRTLVRLTNDTVTIDVHFNEPVGGVNNVLVKWGEGLRVNNTANFIGGNDIVSAGFQQATSVGPGHWRFTADLTGVDEGLHVVKARVFNSRAGGLPALFQTFCETVYVDRSAPNVDTPNLAVNESVDGDRIVTVINADKMASRVEWRVDQGTWSDAYFLQRGEWRVPLTGLSNGLHTLELRMSESDEGQPRSVMRTGTWTRSFTVSSPGLAVTMNRSNDEVVTKPFFETTGTAPAGSTVTLWIDGMEAADLVLNGTSWSQTFTGKVRTGGNERQLTGAFVNGPRFLEVEVVSGGQTQVVSRVIDFNLWGVKDDPNFWRYAYDSDGDGLPDEVELPGFTAGDSPGPNIPWPGDSNWDMIPNEGEVWTRLNPMNHDTTYNGVWDGDEDWDNDGFSNLCEVEQGILNHGNPAFYNIYDAGSRPDACVAGPVAAQISWTPDQPRSCDGQMITVSYSENEGPLNGETPVSMGWTTNGVFAGVMQMNDQGGAWQYTVTINSNVNSLAVWFQNGGGTVFDNAGGNNYDIPLGACVVGGPCWNMDGVVDSTGYEVVDNGMKIWAAVKDDCLYVATWSSQAGVSDHFLFVTDEFGDQMAAPWAKAGLVNVDLSNKPWLAGEGDAGSAFHTLNNGGALGRVAMGVGGQVLEAEVNLTEVFGRTPPRVYVAALAYGDNDGDGINAQAPALWDADNNVQITELQALCIESIRDQDQDGYHDGGQPEMLSIVGTETNDANYNVRRFLIDEMARETAALTLRLYPNTGPGEVLGNVEIITNLNRRDFAVLEEDLDEVVAGSTTNYYRAYPMASIGNGGFEVTLPVNRCGAYRVNARYQVNGQWHYYTDHCLRRDLAVVVSPESVLDVVMYEVNPSIIEATDSTFFGRSTFIDLVTANTNKADVVNVGHFQSLGVNMLWLQPIHPIGVDGRDVNPDTGLVFDPGSPYAVRDYWQVNSILGDPSTPEQAMTEFQQAVAALDAGGIGVMMDGTFNHSAPDLILGQGALDLFPWATNANEEVRYVRPQWYAKAGATGERASYYQSSSDNDIAVAPDRIDFGKWTDVRELYFGNYDALVKGGAPGETGSRHFQEYLLEEDRFDGHDPYTRELWEYFVYYPLYWLDRTGCPEGTPKSRSHLGIDGLRCDFAQGLPSQFWEYCINVTRQRKWNFLFMAESLDGSRTVAGSPRHGIGFRSCRHFDILNENMVFFWRDQFFNYQVNGGGGEGGAANPTTFPIKQNFDDRRDAFDDSPLLLNLTSHDEVFPSDSPYRLLYAYAALSAMNGVPMIMYGQEAGALNDASTYGNQVADTDHNWTFYESNFGKAIPNFKRYNDMVNVWANRDWNLQGLYGRIGQARLGSPALRSPSHYFLSRTDNGQYDPDIFALVKLQEPGRSAAEQDVVMVFVNNNYESSANRIATYDLSATAPNGTNWFGILPGNSYNIVNLIGANTNFLWGTDMSGSTLINNGITVLLNGDPFAGEHAQYLRLVDRTDGAPADLDGDGVPDALDSDDDGDLLPDDYEIANGLDPRDPAGDNGTNGDMDGDGFDNYSEMIAGTLANDGLSLLRLDGAGAPQGDGEVAWPTVPGRSYRLWSTTGSGWTNTVWEQVIHFTADGNRFNVREQYGQQQGQKTYRVSVDE